jgi:hypothetical protein
MLQHDASFDGAILTDYFALHKARERPAFIEQAREPDPAMTAPQPAQWYAVVESQLGWISSLRENWDGYGAAPVDHAAIRRAWRFLREVMPVDAIAPDIGPTKVGLLQFDWHTDTADLEIRMRPAGEFAVSFDDIRSPERSWEDLVAIDDLRRVSEAIREISGRA